MNLTPHDLFHALADDTRLRSLMLLAHEGELCVCELTHALGVVQPKVSRHLAMLRCLGIVADRRHEQWIYYRLHPELPDWAKTVIAAAADGAGERDPFQVDRQALASMPNRPGSVCDVRNDPYI